MRPPEFWRHPGPLPALLAPLGQVFDTAGRLRFALARPVRMPVPVLCIGNLVVGGAGKTPVTLAVAARCIGLDKGRGTAQFVRDVISRCRSWSRI